VRAGLQVVSSLVLLGGAPFLQQHGPALAAALASYVGAVNERGILLLLPPIDLMLVLFPSDAPPLLAPALSRLLALLLGGGEPPGVQANVLGVVARLSLQNPAAFRQLLAEAAASAAAAPGSGGGGGEQQRLEAAVGALAALWVERFDSIGPPLARKLSAAALCALLPLPTKAQLAHAGAIAAAVTAAYHEVEASGDGGPDGTLYCGAVYDAPRGDDGGWGGEAAALSEEAAGEAARRAQARAAVARGAGARVGVERGLVERVAAGRRGAAPQGSRLPLAAFCHTSTAAPNRPPVPPSPLPPLLCPRQALEAEPLRRLRLSAFLRDQLAAAAAVHGPELQAAMSGLGEGLGQQLQAVLAAAG
jgi:hypothetical protein